MAMLKNILIIFSETLSLTTSGISYYYLLTHRLNSYYIFVFLFIFITGISIYIENHIWGNHNQFIIPEPLFYTLLIILALICGFSVYIAVGQLRSAQLALFLGGNIIRASNQIIYAVYRCVKRM